LYIDKNKIIFIFSFYFLKETILNNRCENNEKMLDYILHLGILIGIYFILAIALQISLGFTGMFNIGHIAFFGIGAYTSALFVLYGFPFWIGLLLAGIFAMIFGFILAIPTKNFKGDYFSLIALWFSLIMYSLFMNLKITRGAAGLFGIPKPILFGFDFSSIILFFILVLIVSIICFLIVYRITISKFGKVLQAVRDDELAAKSIGKNTFKIRVISLMISAFFAGIAGSLYAHYISYISPETFTLMNLMPIIIIVIIGGLASLRGTLIASFLILLLPEVLKFILPSPLVGPLKQVIYAFILIVILLYKPKGFFGKVELE